MPRTQRTASWNIADGSFLGVPAETDGGRLLAEEDLADPGFVMNVTKLWMHDPEAMTALFELIVPSARAAGFDTAQILRLTLFVALRVAFATVNGALGARPEREYVEHVDPVVRDAWSSLFG